MTAVAQVLGTARVSRTAHLLGGARAERSRAAHTSTEHTRLRITRRGRLALTTLVVSPLLALGVVGGVVAGVNATAAIATSAGAGSSAVAVEFDYLTINTGESLWQVAERIAPTSDPRDVIADIVSLNQLPTSSVEPGQRIAIPAAYSAGS